LKDLDQNLIWEAYAGEEAVEAYQLIELLTRPLDEGGLGFRVRDDNRIPGGAFSIVYENPLMPMTIEVLGKDKDIVYIKLAWVDAVEGEKLKEWSAGSEDNPITKESISKKIGEVLGKYFKDTE
tara:strand:- start:149 stop:520 length:372 start_codon:yes stop_codon:yes gene_type:complete